MTCALFLATAGAASAQQRVEISASVEDGFGRVIISFADRLQLPDYELRNENGVLAVTFDEAFTTQLPDVGRILSDYVSIARLDPDNEGVRFGLTGPVTLDEKVAGEALYIDFLPTDWQGLPPALPEEVVARLAQRAEDAEKLAEERRRAELVEQYNPTASVHVGRHPTFVRVVFDWNVGTSAEYTREGDTGRIAFDWPVPIDLYEARSDMPAEVVSVSNSVGRIDSEVSVDVAEGTPMRFYKEGPSRFILDVDLPRDAQGSYPGGPVAAQTLLAAVEADDSLVAEPAIVAQPQVGSDGIGPDVAAPAPQVEVVPYVETMGNTVRVVFPFAAETPAAVFRRGDVVWMLFDTGVQVRRPTDMGALDAIATALDVVAAGGAKVVRLTLDADRLASLGSEGKSWVLSLGDVLLDSTIPITFDRRERGADTWEVTAELPRPGRVHQLRDPEVGDILEVVTAYPPARGVVRDLEYVDFFAPQSAHGVVIRPRRDGVDVTIAEDKVVVSGEGGLTLSPPVDRRYRTPVASRDSRMDLEALRVRTPIAYQEHHEGYLARTASSEGRALDHARLDLARFYLANDLAQEALGVLSVLRKDLTAESLEPDVLIAQAAAQTLARRPQEAMPVLLSDDLGDEADTMIWRTIARVQMRDFKAARLDAMGAREAVAHYPRWVRTRYQFAAMRAAIAENDPKFASEIFRDIDLEGLTSPQISEYELLAGRLDALNGRFAQALESFGRVIAADDRPSVAEAVVETIATLDKLGQLDVEKAAESLAVQSTIWRGDHIEEKALQLLADLQFRDAQYRDGFTTVRNMATSHESSDVLDDMVQQARTEFETLYLDGGADALDPVTALSIYYDFRHLTPTGRDGDVMIRNLAQRLVKVDLLDQAADLLAYQVDNRLEGAARAQVAADLAVVQIANRNPAKALEAIYQTRLAGLPPALERQRRVLEARALIDADRQDLALDLLSSLDGRDTELLRVEALWDSERYREAGETIEALYATDLAEGALSPVARMNVVKAGVAYVLAGDTIGLSRLRTKYSGAMAGQPEWPMFAYVTDSVQAGGREFREVAHRIAAVDSLNAFLNAYRERYTAGQAVTPLRAATDDPAAAV